MTRNHQEGESTHPAPRTRGARSHLRGSVGGVVAIIAVIVALAIPATASAVDYFHGNLCCGSRGYSGWNYWYAEEAYKNTTGSSYLGMQNNAGTSRSIFFTGTYKYVDKTMLSMSGYLRGWVEGASSYYIWYDAYICVC